MRESLTACRAAFDGRLALYSNSAGLLQFDPDGGWAAGCWLVGGWGQSSTGQEGELAIARDRGRGGALGWAAVEGPGATDASRRTWRGAASLHPSATDLCPCCWFFLPGKEAEALEAALGVPVLRHREKKPAGGAEDMEAHFGCANVWRASLPLRLDARLSLRPGTRAMAASPALHRCCAGTDPGGSCTPSFFNPACCRCKAEQLIMVGDRFLTDIVFGNRNGMFTIRPAPFTARGEPQAVRLVSDPLVLPQALPASHGLFRRLKHAFLPLCPTGACSGGGLCGTLAAGGGEAAAARACA